MLRAAGSGGARRVCTGGASAAPPAPRAEPPRDGDTRPPVPAASSPRQALTRGRLGVKRSGLLPVMARGNYVPNFPPEPRCKLTPKCPVKWLHNLRICEAAARPRCGREMALLRAWFLAGLSPALPTPQLPQGFITGPVALLLSYGIFPPVPSREAPKAKFRASRHAGAPRPSSLPKPRDQERPWLR